MTRVTDGRIRFLITGGTIDKEYDAQSGNLVFSRTRLGDILTLARCRAEFVVEVVMLKDSLDMTMEDRLLIRERCLAAPESRIVITHGTDTMADTARVLGPAVTGKAVALVGAMIPYSFVHSDAGFNLGCAVTAVQCMPPGVYVTMNGRIFTWDNVRKNREIGEFGKLKE
ncbi:L-asparaginase/GlutRNAGln amidotransferase subunit D [Desulfocurvibacter africanus PCS]|uniref:L-asparaginase/GlutRNAGln amidotransferase subunit D n=1 Tax=Desulfocurvibacter africanus PCS TaxID=1262666 RepID=M5PRI6_DESAF|nr:asparaginase domain-containing protein [Desulfocurvibacter africanus]EMG36685.1 L-asparaginase/GlutRNAGln amidotransferase subunit D [Desulfocurvibacter africanus PCS]